MKRSGLLFYVSLVVLAVGSVRGQEAMPREPLETVAQPVAQPVTPSPLAGLNPALLQRMRSDLSFELKQIRLMLAQIDPNDTPLNDTLKGQQGELLSQLKDINEELKAQGITPPDAEPVKPETDVQPTSGVPDTLINVPAEELPPDVPTRRIPLRIPPRGAVGGSVPGEPPFPPTSPSPGPRTGIFPDDPGSARGVWDVPPSKEMVALRETVAALQKEIESMRADIKALDMQIRLLNRNILLQSQGKPATE